MPDQCPFRRGAPGADRSRLEDSASRDVFQATPGIVDQQQVDAPSLQAVPVVQPLGVDEGHVALAVLGDGFLGTRVGPLSAWVNGTTSPAKIPMAGVVEKLQK